MEKDSLIPAMEVRFTEQVDTDVYGDRWFTYDEMAILGLAARDLIRLEAAMGSPMPSVMKAFRADSAYGNLCAAWLAVRQSGNDVAFAEFDPIISFAEWRAKESEVESDPGKASISNPGNPPSDSPRPDSSPDGPDAPSADIYVLPIMPLSESSTS